MKIKAQGLLNAGHFLEEEYGAAALEAILAACSPAVRERYRGGIALDWHPVEEFVEFATVADTRLGKGDGAIAEKIGEAGARANMKHVLIRFLVYVSKPDFLMRRIAGLWRQFNDEGTMQLALLTPKESRLELTGVKPTYKIFCDSLTGWCRATTEAIGAIAPVARHNECVARGSKRCVWEIRWEKTKPGVKFASG